MHSSKPRFRWPNILTLTAATLFATMTASAAEATGEQAFTAENTVAMARMMKGMEDEPSGNVDLDFAKMMIAHHQGAIDMALAELRHGRNQRLRRLAQEVVVAQRQEVEIMQMVIDRELAGADNGMPQKAAANSTDAATAQTARSRNP